MNKPLSVCIPIDQLPALHEQLDQAVKTLAEYMKAEA